TKSIQVGQHPSGMTASRTGKFLYVANANSDTVSVIDTKADKVIETIDCKPEGKLPFGSGSNAVAIDPKGHQLYVANGTNNSVAVVLLTSSSSELTLGNQDVRSLIAGLIPTGWYPGAICVAPVSNKIFVANVK